MTVSDRGIVTLPNEIRKKAGIPSGGPVSVRITSDGILLIPVAAFPIEMYSDERLAEFEEEEAKLAKFKSRSFHIFIDKASVMRIFIDANILYSASLPGSLMARFITIVLTHAECVTSPYAAEEARRNIERRKPNFLIHLQALLRRCTLHPGFEKLQLTSSRKGYHYTRWGRCISV